MRKKTGIRTMALGMAALLTVSGSNLTVLATTGEIESSSDRSVMTVSGNDSAGGTAGNGETITGEEGNTVSGGNAGIRLSGNEKLPSPILITEVVPNTKNLNGSDAYEYYELCNVSDRDINMDDYNIVYVNGNKRTVWKGDVSVIPANSSMLVWVKNAKNQELTKADFYTYYSLTDGLVAQVSCDGMSNSGIRSMTVETKTGKLLSTVTYNAADSNGGKLDEDEAVAYKYIGEQVQPVYDQTPTPFAAEISGNYSLPEAVPDAFVKAVSESRMNADSSLTVTVTDTNLDIQNIISGTITVQGADSYSLTYDENGQLSGNIPGGEVKELESFTYTVSVFDGVNTATSAPQTVEVLSGNADAFKAPALVLTEILPDSSNIDGADAYEFIELYNNSNREINLKDYKLYYHYPTDGSDVVWWETDGDKFLEAGQALVFWVKNGKNDNLTRDDFNRKFGTSLEEGQLIEISCGGMANGSPRGLRICSNVKDDIDFITYNMTDVDDTTADKSITYRNTYADGSFRTVMTSNSQIPTPGTITDVEKPDYQAVLTVPSDAPVLEDRTAESFTNETETLTFELKAGSAETTIKTVRLYLKYNDREAFECYNLFRSYEDYFAKSLTNVDLLNKKSFTYYFEVSDGFSVIRTKEKTIENTSISQTGLFSLADGEMITGSRQVIACGDSLFIDGNRIEETVPSINGAGKIAFDASQTDVFFKNAVAVGDNVIGIFNEGTYDQWRTYVYDIDAELYDADSKTITVAFHAGNKANALEHNIENNDDFVLKNIRMVLPGGETLYPASYQAKKGLGAVEHDGLDDQSMQDVTITSQEKEIQIGDGTSKYEILYVTFDVPQKEFCAVRYLWETAASADSISQTADGMHTISNGSNTINVTVDNTAPVITANVEEGREYHSGSIEVNVADAGSGVDRTDIWLDGEKIETPYSFRAIDMEAGQHILSITASDVLGNTAERIITFSTPEESAEIGSEIKPADGAVVDGTPTFSVKVTDSTNDVMQVSFKRGERYELGDRNITKESGVSNVAGTAADIFDPESGNGFPYEIFTIDAGDITDETTVLNIKWSGTSNNLKTFLFAYNTVTGNWDKLDTEQSADGESMTLQGELVLKEYLSEGAVKVMVQNGEGYTPAQYGEAASADTNTEPRSNADDTPRSDYQFTFAVESDTQYYNEDYEGNPNKDVDGVYQYQLDIHNWVLANRERMNIQYLFHNGDIIDDEPNVPEWENADAAYRLLDDADFPYGLLAGNHDVGHLSGDYTKFSQYFGENRYIDNPWYGESYQDNRGHYDLITIDGIDFIMIFVGWGIGDEEIEWMNQVLAQYPERKAILNFHEYLLASGGMGEEPQRIHDEVVAKNDNVCMVLSGHYHNAYTRVDTFTKEDGTERKVYNLLFDYQGLPQGGLGYMRLMHFDTVNDKMIVRTYSPSLNDYDAQKSAISNEGNSYVVPNASINGEENFEISFADLGIVSQVKKLDTTGLSVNFYGNEMIGTVKEVVSGTCAEYEWTNAPTGKTGWYAEVTDENGGLTRTGVQYVTISEKKIPTEPTEPTVPTESQEPTVPTEPNKPVDLEKPAESDDDTPASGSTASEPEVDWNKVTNDVRVQTDAQSGGINLDVVAGSNIVVPASTLASLKDKKQSKENVTLALHTGEGVTFSLSSVNMTANANSSMNLTVRSGQLHVSTEQVAEKTRGAITAKQISMVDHSNFGMVVNLHLNMGAENSGKFANLYRYNDANGRLEYAGSFRIVKNGQAMFGLTKGAEYLVTVTNARPNEKMTAGNGTSHRVERGDSLSKIAARYGMSVLQLLALNPDIHDANKIIVGQNVRVR